MAQVVYISPPDHLNPMYIRLADVVNARVKIQHGSLTHRVTARLLDNHASVEKLQALINTPYQVENLAAQIAAQIAAQLQAPPAGTPQVVGQMQQPSLTNSGGLIKKDYGAQVLVKTKIQSYTIISRFVASINSFRH
jgi:hypothetical protein